MTSRSDQSRADSLVLCMFLSLVLAKMAVSWQDGISGCMRVLPCIGNMIDVYNTQSSFRHIADNSGGSCIYDPPTLFARSMILFKWACETCRAHETKYLLWKTLLQSREKWNFSLERHITPNRVRNGDDVDKEGRVTALSTVSSGLQYANCETSSARDQECTCSVRGISVGPWHGLRTTCKRSTPHARAWRAIKSVGVLPITCTRCCTILQAAEFSQTGPAPPESKPPKTPVSKPRTVAEGTIEAEAGACTGTASRTTRKRAAAKNSFKQPSSKPQPAETARAGAETGTSPPWKCSLHPRYVVCPRVNQPQEHPWPGVSGNQVDARALHFTYWVRSGLHW